MEHGRFAFAGNDVVGAYVERCLAACGWDRCDDIRSAGAIFTYFTTSGALEDAYFDEGGIVKAAQRHALLVDLSPCAPSLSRELSAVSAVNDLRFVEAPLAVADPTLPDAFASPENLVCFAAGDDDDLAQARVMLDELADDLRFSGGHGTAQLSRAVHTIQQAAQIGAAVESDALMRAARLSGLAGALDREVDPTSELVGLVDAAVGAGAFEGSYTVEMLMGEIVAAMSAADDADLILPQLESVMHLLEILAVIGGADMSPAALSLVYRDEASSAAHGLDWSRAEGLFTDEGRLHEHAHGDAADFSDFDEFGYAGGFGGYSAN